MSTYRQISKRRLTKKVELAQSQAHVYFAGMSYFLVLVAIVPELAPFNIYVCQANIPSRCLKIAEDLVVEKLAPSYKAV